MDWTYFELLFKEESERPRRRCQVLDEIRRRISRCQNLKNMKSWRESKTANMRYAISIQTFVICEEHGATEEWSCELNSKEIKSIEPISVTFFQFHISSMMCIAGNLELNEKHVIGNCLHAFKKPLNLYSRTK